MKTTPQVFTDGRRIGGTTTPPVPGQACSRPHCNDLHALRSAFHHDGANGHGHKPCFGRHLFTPRGAGWFIEFSMVALSLFKLQDVGSFATMFLKPSSSPITASHRILMKRNVG